MAMAFFESIGPRGQELAMAAGDRVGVPVGFDPDLESATFDSDDHDEDQLREAVLAALEEIDPDWNSHLRVAE
jgi:hypothetical protein